MPACDMWGEMEMALARLAQGDAEAALEHTGRAVAVVSRSDESWIGFEDVRHAHACALRALNRAEEADEQVRLAGAIIIAAKAGRIPDPGQRRRYLESKICPP